MSDTLSFDANAVTACLEDMAMSHRQPPAQNASRLITQNRRKMASLDQRLAMLAHHFHSIPGYFLRILARVRRTDEKNSRRALSPEKMSGHSLSA